MMDLEKFYARLEGKAPLSVYDFETKTRSIIDANVHSFVIGEVNVPSGLLAASDPYVDIESPLVFDVPAGTYPVYVTVADVSAEQNKSHYRECYLSIILNENEPVSISGAIPKDREDDLVEGTFYGVGVDAGIVGFFDYEAGQELNRTLEEDPDSLFDFLEEELTEKNNAHVGVFQPEGIEGNFVYSHSGWGDGFYPVLKTLDKDGNITGFHIDLGVLGIPDSE